MSGSIGNFSLALQLIMQDNGSLKCASRWMNDGVPMEMIILQLKAFIQQAERKYFTQFDQETGSQQ